MVWDVGLISPVFRHHPDCLNDGLSSPCTSQTKGSPLERPCIVEVTTGMDITESSVSCAITLPRPPDYGAFTLTLCASPAGLLPVRDISR